MILSQVRKHYREFKISPNLVFKFVAFLCVVFLVASIYNHFKNSNYFPIKEVKVAGLKHIDEKQFQDLLVPYVKSGFFAVSVSNIKNKIREFSWIEDSEVSRIWPNQVVINVVEKTPIANWNDSSLLTTHGEIFNPGKYDEKPLPAFIGPPGVHVQMLDYYNRMQALLTPLKFKVQKLELTPALSWRITFDNGLKVNTQYNDALSGVKRLVKAYPKIVGNRVKDVEYIDLRYQDGMAVHWKHKV